MSKKELPETKQALICFDCSSLKKKFLYTAEGEQACFICEETYCDHYFDRPMGVLLTKEELERMK